MNDVAKLGERPDSRLGHSHIRMDARRDTRLMVTRNVNGHAHITLGRDEATLILHPHFVKRLMLDLERVMDGADFAAD